jgi:hypothetical protein
VGCRYWKLEWQNIGHKQCFGSRCAWILKRFAAWIRIHMKNVDLDPDACKFVPRARSQGFKKQIQIDAERRI